MCVCMYMCICLRACAYVYIYANLYLFMYVYKHAHLYMCICTSRRVGRGLGTAGALRWGNAPPMYGGGMHLNAPPIYWGNAPPMLRECTCYVGGRMHGGSTSYVEGMHLLCWG